MRTNIVIDNDLIREASELTGIKTKRELVNTALRLLVSSVRRKSLLDIAGKIKLAEGYDYKSLRKARS
jgi:Arc/MetJ family transcription regulator